MHAARALLLAVVFLAPLPTLGFSNEPTGFGKARLGMTVDEVKQAFPTLKAVSGSAPDPTAPMAFYNVDDQTVFGLKHCRVELRFNPLRLYEISFDCGNDLKVMSALEKRFGQPTTGRPGAALWESPRVVVSLNVKSRVFAFMDRELNQELQARLMAYVLAHQATPGVAAQPAVPTPQP